MEISYTSTVSSSLETMTSLASPLGLHLFGSEPDPISHTTRVTIPEGLQLALSEISPYGRNPVNGGGQSDVWKADLIRDGAKTVLVNFHDFF